MIRVVKKTVKQVLRPLVNPWVSVARLAEDMRSLGVAKGGILLVHSSLSSLGYVPGGPQTVLDALRRAIGEDGTLVLPTHTFRQMNAGCRTFDARNTESCVGALTEAFRRLPGVRRSLHPTHSVAALGPLAESLIQGHELALTPCGDQTPYARILDADGQILLLGVGLKNLTVFHTAEALANLSYLMQTEDETFTLIDAAGQPKSMTLRRHQAGVSRCFPELEPFLTETGVLRRGTIGPATSMLLQGLRFRESMVQRLQSEPSLLLAK